MPTTNNTAAANHIAAMVATRRGQATLSSLTRAVLACGWTEEMAHAAIEDAEAAGLIERRGLRLVAA